jgi:pantetheine-phosphate adenylyltransferase
MRMLRKAVYAGSFDPLTNGHLWMIERGAELFDELYVAVGSNPDKRGRFSVPNRLHLIHASLKGRVDLARVLIDSFENRFLVDYARGQTMRFILRGVRSASDFEFEQTMRHVNADLAPQITTVFLTPPRELSAVSSSFVMGLVGPDGWEEIVRNYVPAPVFAALKGRKR